MERGTKDKTPTNNLVGEKHLLLGARIDRQRAEHIARPLVRSLAKERALARQLCGAFFNPAPASGVRGRACRLWGHRFSRVVLPAEHSAGGFVEDGDAKVRNGCLVHSLLDPDT